MSLLVQKNSYNMKPKKKKKKPTQKSCFPVKYPDANLIDPTLSVVANLAAEGLSRHQAVQYSFVFG